VAVVSGAGEVGHDGRVFADLTPPYRTIVADPPWSYDEGWPMSNSAGQKGNKGRKPLAYSTMTVDEIAALPVGDLAADDAHCYLWTTNRYLWDSFDVLAQWGFVFSQVLVWCKPPRGLGPGGAYSITTEFVLFGRRGKLAPKQRADSTWWQWSRMGHSRKPPGFLDVVEQVSPGPYVELFCREPRFGWDSWGRGFEAEREAS
jgi:N6-adenosine-specific RNA methylase IME4